MPQLRVMTDLRNLKLAPEPGIGGKMTFSACQLGDVMKVLGLNDATVQVLASVPVSGWFGRESIEEQQARIPGGLFMYSLIQDGFKQGQRIMVIASVPAITHRGTLLRASGESVAYELWYVMRLLQQGWYAAGKNGTEQLVPNPGIYYENNGVLTAYKEHKSGISEIGSRLSVSVPPIAAFLPWRFPGKQARLSDVLAGLPAPAAERQELSRADAR